MGQRIGTHEDLQVFQQAYALSMEIFSWSKSFPQHEMYSLTDQIRRSSRSVCANLAEAFRKRKYPKVFVAKIFDSEGEAAETQVWLKYARDCKYINQRAYTLLHQELDYVIGKLVVMRNQPEKWVIP